MSSSDSTHGTRLLGKAIALLAFTGLMAYGWQRAKSERAAAQGPGRVAPGVAQTAPTPEHPAAIKPVARPDNPGEGR
jgi:hypothetical protein